MYPIQPNDKFCRGCGKEVVQRLTGEFDPKTGKPMTTPVCINLTCRVGCDQNGGHRFKFWGRTCKRCGTYFPPADIM